MFVGSNSKQENIEYGKVVQMFQNKQVKSFYVDDKDYLYLSVNAIATTSDLNSDAFECVHHLANTEQFNNDLGALIMAQTADGTLVRYDFKAITPSPWWMSYLPYLIVVVVLIVIFVMFGPLMMTGVYYAITGTVDWKISWLSIAVGLLVTTIVYSHSVLDAIPDAKMGKKTMAHLMGSARGQIVLSALINTLPYIMVVAGVVLGQMHMAYLTVLAVLPLSIWLIRSLNDYVNHKEVKIEIKPWMGPMGDFDAYRKAGVDWFLLRWLVARNIVQFFCMIVIVVNFIVNIFA